MTISHKPLRLLTIVAVIEFDSLEQRREKNQNQYNVQN